MNDCLDMNEVRDLCYDLQVDFENLLGERKIDKIKALVGLFYRQNLLRCPYKLAAWHKA
jgi:hypothetical protein